MAVSVMPVTKFGAWGFWLSVAFVGLFVLKITTPFPLPSPIIFAVGGVGLILNIVALVRRERAALFFIVGLLVGLFVVFWVGGELLFPH
jgi:hypothetical protein